MRYKVLNCKEKLSLEPMNEFQMMNFLRSKYQDYAQIIKNKNNIFLFSGKHRLIRFDVEKQELDHDPINANMNLDLTYFRMSTHMTDCKTN